MKKLMLALSIILGTSTVFARSMPMEECVQRVSANAVKRGGYGYSGETIPVKFIVEETPFNQYAPKRTHLITVWVQTYANRIYRVETEVDKNCEIIHDNLILESSTWRNLNIQLK